jgi:ABC-type uncharacterized transport system permease subunit
MSTIFFLIQQTMFFTIPLMVVALGGMFSERSGVINIALEGIMILGGFCSILFINIMQNNISGQILLILAIIVAMISGAAFSMLHAYAAINMKADQTISGTALNMLAPALTIFMARMIQPSGVQQIQFNNTFRIEKVPLLGDIPFIVEMFFQNTYITTYFGVIVLIISAVLLYKTKFGLRLRACGEHPQAADAVGVSVYKMRYIGVAISGVLAGLGGLIFVVTTSTNFNANVAGYGFLALAVLIFGQWNPYRIAGAALFFGFMKTISATYSSIPWLYNLPITGYFYKMIPYIATLIVLLFSSKKSQAPKAEGIPYDQGAR